MEEKREGNFDVENQSIEQTTSYVFSQLCICTEKIVYFTVAILFRVVNITNDCVNIIAFNFFSNNIISCVRRFVLSYYQPLL